MKLGIIREGKNPPDKRVPFTPKQCAEINKNYPGIELVVQPSDVRAIKDSDYEAEGITLQEDVSDCDVLMGVKEVNKKDLIEGKTYFYFSHTIKEQPYNRDLLRKMLSLNIRMIDYETLTYDGGGRILGFGRYAGIVGAYNGFLAYGKKTKSFDLKSANTCDDRLEMESELSKVTLPSNYKIVLTGTGRVGRGAVEILEKLNLKEVSQESFLTDSFSEPVYTVLDIQHYNSRKDGGAFDQNEFFTDASDYRSDFMKYAEVSDMYIACHFWGNNAPFIFTREDAKSGKFGIKIVADISCDIDGPVACTLEPSTIANPLYGYDTLNESVVDFEQKDSVGVMAVDNLPCELPKDASEDFGKALLEHIIPRLAGEDVNKVLERASMCEAGKLTKYYSHLQDYVDGK